MQSPSKICNFSICETTYGPTAPDSFHVAEDLEVPELGACDLQVVDAILSQAFLVQVRAGESLFVVIKAERIQYYHRFYLVENRSQTK